MKPESIVGKTIAGINESRKRITIAFTDGSQLVIESSFYITDCDFETTCLYTKVIPPDDGATS